MEKDIKLNSKRIKWTKSQDQKMDWGLKLLNVSDSWKDSKGEGVNIAVLDTGIAHHDDLSDNVKGGVNFSYSNDLFDHVGHGTHVAGIIAGVDNNRGIVGVAPKANIYGYKVLDDDGFGSFDAIERAIRWAIESNIDIISMSLGYSVHNPEVYREIKRAYAKNITIVAAAGNDGDNFTDNDIDYPAKYPEVIAVGSINKYEKRSWFSGDGKELEISAPGQDINSTFLNNEYAVLSGTSMATPFVSGIIALMIAKHRKKGDNRTPIANPSQIREHLKRTAIDAGMVGRDRFFGYGIINPNKLLDGVKLSSLYREI